MRALAYGFVGALVWMAAATPPAAAQDAGWWGWALEVVWEDRDVRRSATPHPRVELRGAGDAGQRIRVRDPRARRPLDRKGRARSGRDDRRAGPPFCRNGQGHPVHGMAWCREKGFGAVAHPPVVWRQQSWNLPRLPRFRSERRGALLGPRSLYDVLGDGLYRRLTSDARQYGGGELLGRWHRPDRGVTVLQIRSGRFPVAELTDLDGDGWVDVVLVAGR